MQITFQQIERDSWFMRDHLVFDANVDGKHVKCVFPRVFLRVGFGDEAATEALAIQRFNERKPEIEDRLRKMIKEDGLTEEGEAIFGR